MPAGSATFPSTASGDGLDELLEAAAFVDLLYPHASVHAGS